ncbi:MAG: hypothetical protein RLY31_3151 [Bacteroidota bacterium]|jgi:AcrR family transcriptional regulator
MHDTPIKQRILEEAAKLFQEKGYLAASMRDIADRVGLRVSSLYSHFSGKEELLRLICFDCAEKYLAGMRTFQRLEIPASEKVRRLIRMHIQIATHDITSVTIFNDEWQHLSEPHFGQFLALRREYESQFGDIIRQGIAERTFEDVHVRVTLSTILTSLRWLHRQQPDRQGLPAAELEKAILQLILKGLEKR